MDDKIVQAYGLPHGFLYEEIGERLTWGLRWDGLRMIVVHFEAIPAIDRLLENLTTIKARLVQEADNANSPS